MFKDPKDKSKNKKKSNQAHLGNHLTDFTTDMFLGGNKEDINSTFSPSAWTNPPKNQDKKKKK